MKHCGSGSAAVERWALGNDWLIFPDGRWDMNPAKVDRLEVRDPLKEKHRSSAVSRLQPSLNPCSSNTAGQRGPRLTGPRLCHQSHSTSRIFSGNRSINSWLHSCSLATQRFILPALNFTCEPGDQVSVQQDQDPVHTAWFPVNWIIIWLEDEESQTHRVCSSSEQHWNNINSGMKRR